MHNGVAVTALLSLAAIFSLSIIDYSDPFVSISGFASGADTIDVQVLPVDIIHLNVTVSDVFPDVGDTETITVEIKNLGSTTNSAQLEVTILTFNGTLNPVATFFDSTINYVPGIERIYTTIYVVPTEDLFFVRARLPFGSTTYETFAVFTSLPPPPPTGGGGTTTGGTGGGGGGASGPANQTIIEEITIPPKINVSNPGRAVVAQGDSLVVPITVDNTGGTVINDIRLLLSLPTALDFNINPPQKASLSPTSAGDGNNRTTFLVTINVPADTPVGDYGVEFEVIARETNGAGNFVIEIVPPGFIDEEELNNRILSYELIVTDLDQQVVSADRRGFDVSGANESLNMASAGLDRAKIFLSRGDLQNTRKELFDVIDDLERATLQLATATFFVSRLPTVNQIILIVAALALVSGFVAFLFYRKKKKKQRPRILRKISAAPEKENK